MLNNALAYLTLFISLTHFCKCTYIPEPRQVNQTIAPDFVREVPHDDNFYEYINREAFALQLDSLEAGYDSLQFRIWLGHSMAIVNHIVILKCKDQKWDGQLVSFSIDDENNYVNKKVRKISPRSGWGTLIDSLYKLKIATLPHETNIAGYNGAGADGISYDFEIATSKSYRIYRYSNPEENIHFRQAVLVLQIANLLENEFDLQYIK